MSRCCLWIALDKSFQKMYGFWGVGLSEVQLSISELSVVGGGGGGPDKRTSWSDLHRVRQKQKCIFKKNDTIQIHYKMKVDPLNLRPSRNISLSTLLLLEDLRHCLELRRTMEGHATTVGRKTFTNEKFFFSGKCIWCFRQIHLIFLTTTLDKR